MSEAFQEIVIEAGHTERKSKLTDCDGENGETSYQSISPGTAATAQLSNVLSWNLFASRSGKCLEA